MSDPRRCRDLAVALFGAGCGVVNVVCYREADEQVAEAFASLDASASPPVAKRTARVIARAPWTDPRVSRRGVEIHSTAAWRALEATLAEQLRARGLELPPAPQNPKATR